VLFAYTPALQAYGLHASWLMLRHSLGDNHYSKFGEHFEKMEGKMIGLPMIYVIILLDVESVIDR
jgi:hypothetical protein